jgi:hypothetical protein
MKKAQRWKNRLEFNKFQNFFFISGTQ